MNNAVKGSGFNPARLLAASAHFSPALSFPCCFAACCPAAMASAAMLKVVGPPAAPPDLPPAGGRESATSGSGEVAERGTGVMRRTLPLPPQPSRLSSDAGGAYDTCRQEVTLKQCMGRAK